MKELDLYIFMFIFGDLLFMVLFTLFIRKVVNGYEDNLRINYTFKGKK